MVAFVLQIGICRDIQHLLREIFKAALVFLICFCEYIHLTVHIQTALAVKKLKQTSYFLLVCEYIRLTAHIQTALAVKKIEVNFIFLARL